MPCTGRLPLTSSHGLHCLSFFIYCIVPPRFTFLPWRGITTDSPLVTKLGCFSTSSRHNFSLWHESERAPINYLLPHLSSLLAPVLFFSWSYLCATIVSRGNCRKGPSLSFITSFTTRSASPVYITSPAWHCSCKTEMPLTLLSFGIA